MQSRKRKDEIVTILLRHCRYSNVKYLNGWLYILKKKAKNLWLNVYSVWLAFPTYGFLFTPQHIQKH